MGTLYFVYIDHSVLHYALGTEQVIRNAHPLNRVYRQFIITVSIGKNIVCLNGFIISAFVPNWLLKMLLYIGTTTLYVEGSLDRGALENDQTCCPAKEEIRISKLGPKL